VAAEHADLLARRHLPKSRGVVPRAVGERPPVAPQFCRQQLPAAEHVKRVGEGEEQLNERLAFGGLGNGDQLLKLVDEKEDADQPVTSAED
jgi:hypothetical protein